MVDQALSDDTAAHDITRNPESIWLSPICDDTAHHGEGRTWAAPSPDETCEDCGEPWVKYVRVDLASVSSASAEARSLIPHLLGHADYDEDFSDGLRQHLRDAARLLAASPEPVPATNQAGEVATAVELLEQYAGFIRNDVKADDLERHPYLPLIEQTIASLNATQPATSQEGQARCPASPDHADIKETIEDAADDWQAQGYTSALAEVRDMAAVGRSLMEALPKGYCYMDSPAEIVSDLQNDLDEARGVTPLPDATQTREAEYDCSASHCAGYGPWRILAQHADSAWIAHQRGDRFVYRSVDFADLEPRAALNARGGA